MSATNDAVKHTGTTDAVKHSGPGGGAVKHTAGAVKHTAGAHGTRYELSAADTERMARLSAEVAARLDEMAQIFATTTGATFGDMSSRYVPETSASDADVTHVEIVCGPDGCGCYVTLADGTGWCEFPCGG